MGPRRRTHGRLVVLAVAALAASQELEEVCEATDGGCRSAAGFSSSGDNATAHYWPHARGHIGQYSVASYSGPRNLSSGPTWSWHHPNGRYHATFVGGPLVDRDKNLYVATEHGVVKLSIDGSVLWTYHSTQGSLPSCPCLGETALFGSTNRGFAFAVSLATGEELWSSQVAVSAGSDTAYLGTDRGVVVGAFDAPPPEYTGNRQVVGLNASDGSQLWMFQPAVPVWNFMPLFTGNGTIIFQDIEGRVYHLGVADGRKLWSAGGSPGTWTDGGALLAPGGRVFGVTMFGTAEDMRPHTPGLLTAYRLADGSELWRQDLPRPPNTWPVEARLGPGRAPLVLMPIGMQGIFPWRMVMLLMLLDGKWNLINFGLGLLIGMLAFVRHLICCRHTKHSWRSGLCCSFKAFWLGWLACWLVTLSLTVAYLLFHFGAGFPSEVRAFEASSGELRWRHEVPVWRHLACAGDAEGFFTRLRLGIRATCLPGPWTSPTVDAEGKVFVGHMSGAIYAFWDSNGDDHVDPETEVSSWDSGASFLHPGAAFAPDLFAIVSCDSLHVWRL